MKQKVYITIAGTNYYHGRDFLEPGMKVRLIKDPDNEHDREAIRVEMDGLGKIGYVANSPWTVQGESLSAGRLYDRIGDTARAKVKHVLGKGVLCVVRDKDLIFDPPRAKSPREADEDGRKI